MNLSETELQVIDLLRLEVDGISEWSAGLDLDISPGVEALALDNEVASTIAFNLAELDRWDEVPQSWRDEYRENKALITAFLSELDHIAFCMANHNIRLVALKNGGIVRGIYPHPGAVPMEDLDVLASKNDFLAVHEILLRQDYILSFKPPMQEASIAASMQAGVAEYVKELPGGQKLHFELHWRPITGRWIRPDQEPGAEKLIKKATAISGTDVLILFPTDNLLQVCLHTARHSYVRAPGLRLHLDVARIIKAYPDLDWETFVQRAQALQVKTATYFSLVIPKELLGVPVPKWTIDALRPPAWKEQTIRRLIAGAGLFNPQVQKFSRLEYILFNALLYDDSHGLWRSMFPDRAWMEEQYHFQNPLLLPYYHVRRIGSLLFRRLAT